MFDVVADLAADEGLRTGLLATAFGFGLRHGVDWDHIAAISDITSSQPDARRSMRLATLYATGHALVVFALGSAAVLAGDLLPAGVDAVMERVVGATLVLLGAYVVVSLVRDGRRFRMRSRWMLVFDGARAARRRLRRREVVIEHDHEHVHHGGHDHPHARDGSEQSAGAVAVRTAHRHRHTHRGGMPEDPFVDRGARTAFGVGMLHGVGAETATQVLVFLAASQAGAGLAGELVLIAFVAGLITSNTAIAAATTFGFLNAAGSFRVYAAVAVLTGAASLVMGTLYLLGQGAVLPTPSF